MFFSINLNSLNSTLFRYTASEIDRHKVVVKSMHTNSSLKNEIKAFIVIEYLFIEQSDDSIRHNDATLYIVVVVSYIQAVALQRNVKSTIINKNNGPQREPSWILYFVVVFMCRIIWKLPLYWCSIPATIKCYSVRLF